MNGARRPGRSVEQYTDALVLRSQTRRGRAAESSVRLGEVSRGRQNLTSAALAPGTAETFNELQDKIPHALQKPVPEEFSTSRQHSRYL